MSSPDNQVASDGTTLSDLAQLIDIEHAACESHAQAALAHARKCGELLTIAKTNVKHGEWLPWLRANCVVSERTAQVYMRVAEGWDQLTEGNTQPAADLTLRGAVALLTGPKAASTAVDRLLADLRAEAEHLVAERDELEGAGATALEEVRTHPFADLNTCLRALHDAEIMEAQIASHQARRDALDAALREIIRAARARTRELTGMVPAE